MNNFDQRILSKCDKCKAFLKKLLHVYFLERRRIVLAPTFFNIAACTISR